jgi:hypothetical protein
MKFFWERLKWDNTCKDLGPVLALTVIHLRCGYPHQGWSTLPQDWNLKKSMGPGFLLRGRVDTKRCPLVSSDATQYFYSIALILSIYTCHHWVLQGPTVRWQCLFRDFQFRRHFPGARTKGGFRLLTLTVKRLTKLKLELNILLSFSP